MASDQLGSNQAMLEFLRTEINTGLTFSHIAMRSHDPDKTDRNRASARKAYNTVLRFLPRLSLTDDQQDEISTGLSRLKSRLMRLGDAF